MKIRKTTKKDFKEIANLMNKEFSKPPFNEKSNLKDILKSIRFFHKIGTTKIAIEDKEIVGVIVFKQEQYWEGPSILIEDLAVRKDFQKKRGWQIIDERFREICKKEKNKCNLFLNP